MAANAPDVFLCPITFDIMRDPVNGPDGRTYERTAIVEALRKRPFSPMTNQPMTEAQLVTNFSMRQAIEQWCRENNAGPYAAGAAVARPTAVPVPQPSAPPTAAVVAPSYNADLKPARTAHTAHDPTIGMGDTTGSLKVRHHVQNNQLLVQLVGEDFDDRGGLNVAVVLDVSGSMDRNASMAGSEKFALTLLDVVKHAARTVVELLEERDSFCLVTFADQARVRHDLQPVTEHARERVSQILKNTSTEGRTNLWMGIDTGLKALLRGGSGGSAPGQQNVLIVLTDGEPNVHPSIGELEALRKFKREHADFRFSLMTMALGFDELASGLLSDLSMAGGGAYTYIPDAGMIGSVFVNCISSLFCRIARDIHIKLSSFSGNLDARPILPYDSPGINEVIIPAAQAQQVHGILFNLEGGEFHDASEINVTVTYACTADLPRGRALPRVRARPAEPLSAVELNRAMEVAVLRTDLVEVLVEATRSLTEKEFKLRVAELRKRNPMATRQMEELFKDMQGQVQLAMDPKYIRRWGAHYLRSLLFAHLLHICNNFKDPGVQVYKTERFNTFQGIGDAMFNNLPPPAASGEGVQVESMRALNDEENPCMHGDTLVHLANGQLKLAREVVAGDVVLTGQPASPTTTVLCVVETRCPSGQAELVTLSPGGLRVTPYHPVQQQPGGQWVFPIDLAPAVRQPCDAVFSFVLAPGASSLLINNTACISLGHGITAAQDPVASHPYFAAAAVDDLRRLPGWTQGRIVFRAGSVLRSRATGLICGFDASKLLTEVEATRSEPLAL